MNNEENLEKDISETTENSVTKDTGRGAESDEDVRSQQAEDADVEFEEVNEEGEADARTTIKKLREKIKKLESEKKEYLDLSQRMRADYMNLKKEVDQERVAGRKFATRRLIEDLLPVLDAYDMAQGNKDAWEAVDKNWRTGIEYIFGQFKAVLEKEGVAQFGNVGDHFDPHLHESMEHVAVAEESQNDCVVQVLQKGYRMGDTILRPARVKTGEFKK
jgi:molecular chaperone GrpE